MADICYVWNNANCEYVKTFNPTTTEKDLYLHYFVTESVKRAKEVIDEYRDPSLTKQPQVIFECRRETPIGHKRLDGMVEFTRIRVVETY